MWQRSLWCRQQTMPPNVAYRTYSSTGYFSWCTFLADVAPADQVLFMGAPSADAPASFCLKAGGLKCCSDRCKVPGMCWWADHQPYDLGISMIRPCMPCLATRRCPWLCKWPVQLQALPHDLQSLHSSITTALHGPIAEGASCALPFRRHPLVGNLPVNLRYEAIYSPGSGR